MDKQIILDAMILRQAVQRVRELHNEEQVDEDKYVCSYDNNIYPCPTIKALDGDS